MKCYTLLKVTAMALLPLAATGCAQEQKQASDKYEDKLADGDPVLKTALADQIMVDPKLTEQSNANAVSPGNRPLDGGAPVYRAAKGGNPDLIAMPVGGKLLATPAPKEMEAEDCKTCGRDPVTPGARMGEVAPGKCNAKLTYGLDWARRMPVGFPVYPRAQLKEAAGVTGECDVRVVNFETAAPMQAVIDYYYTQATKNGYNAEHLTKGAEHYLGGTRTSDDAAYVVILNPTSRNTVDVDIVASGGLPKVAAAQPAPKAAPKK